MRTKQQPLMCSIHLDEHETPCEHPAFYQLISDNGTEYPVCRKHGDNGWRSFGPRVIRLRRITRR